VGGRDAGAGDLCRLLVELLRVLLQHARLGLQLLLVVPNSGHASVDSVHRRRCGRADALHRLLLQPFCRHVTRRRAHTQSAHGQHARDVQARAPLSDAISARLVLLSLTRLDSMREAWN